MSLVFTFSLKQIVNSNFVSVKLSFQYFVYNESNDLASLKSVIIHILKKKEKSAYFAFQKAVTL